MERSEIPTVKGDYESSTWKVVHLPRGFAVADVEPFRYVCVGDLLYRWESARRLATFHGYV